MVFQPGQKRLPGLDHVDGDTALPQSLAHLQGDVAHADDHGFLDIPLVDVLLHGPAVGQAFQDHHPGQIDTRYGRFGRHGAGGDQQAVIGEGMFMPFAIPCGDGLVLRVDGGGFDAGSQVDALLVPEDFGPPDHQILDGAVGVGNVVRHAAGAVGHVGGFFENGHREIRLVAFGPAGGAHAGGIAADDEKIHGSLPWGWAKRAAESGFQRTNDHRPLASGTATRHRAVAIEPFTVNGREPVWRVRPLDRLFNP